MNGRQQPPRKRAKMLLLAAMTLVLFTGAPPLQVHAAPASTSVQAELPSKLEQQIQMWVDRLSEQKAFQSWQTADPQIEALGPGTHSWLVLFTKEGKDIGYMVVHAVTDGTFQLGEYGTGPYSLFSQMRLKQSLVDSGLISDEKQPFTAVKHYIHPFAAAWEVTIGQETVWLDAKSAEQLPVNRAQWQTLFPHASSSIAAPPKTGLHSSAIQLNEPFDAYERLPWLTKEAPFSTKDAAKLQQRLDNNKHLRYVTEPFGDAMLYAVPVIGYQRWSNGRLDLAIDMEGTRFIPFDTLRNDGLFYR